MVERNKVSILIPYRQMVVTIVQTTALRSSRQQFDETLVIRHSSFGLTPCPPLSKISSPYRRVLTFSRPSTETESPVYPFWYGQLPIVRRHSTLAANSDRPAA